MKKFAFILLGNGEEPTTRRCFWEDAHMHSAIYTVQDFEAAGVLVQQLQGEGFGCVELCGAFGPQRAQALADLTQGQMAVGYVTHHPHQDDLFAKFFGI